MAEPEEVIIEGAHLATTYVAELWRRNRRERGQLPELADVRRRLSHFVAGFCPAAPEIGVAEPPVVPHMLARLMRRTPAHLVERSAQATTDGVRIRLPRDIGETSERAAMDAWNLLALGQALRAQRGTPDFTPSEPAARDLYMLAEATAVDAIIAREAPGLGARLAEGRRRERLLRPPVEALTAAEQAVEVLYRAVLESPPLSPPEAVPLASTPRESLEWAQRVRDGLSGDGRYRGIRLVPMWGSHALAPEGHASGLLSPGVAAPPPADRTNTMTRRPRVRSPDEDEDDTGPGMWMLPIDDRQEKAEDPMGLTRPADRDDMADPAELADALSELPEARLVRSPEAAREVLASDDPPPGAHATIAGAVEGRLGIAYPEWDYRRGAYIPGRVIVRLSTGSPGTEPWVKEALRRNGRLIREVRRRFERLRPRRERLSRQPDGPDVDMDAYVAAFADRHAGHAVDDRLYQTHRPLRRELAIALLVDASASTDSWVAGHRRIIDVEKDALIVVAEALDALGDRYAIEAFSGDGPRHVRLARIKAFDERYGQEVRRRIGAIEPDRYTRLGAAIRHTATGLMRERCSQRLLLVLSDGKPNDVDIYEGRYGIEDARQAVAEANLQRIHTFCITVDREAPIYLPRIFGGSMTVLRHAEALPRVLVDVVRRLVAQPS